MTSPENSGGAIDAAHASTLLIVDGVPTAADLSWLRTRISGSAKVVVLEFQDRQLRHPRLQDESTADRLPADWPVIAADVREAARDAFLPFLESVVESDRPASKRVRDLAPLAGEYSVWWTVGPGNDRHPLGNSFLAARACRSIRHAMESVRPARVLCHASSANAAAIVGSLMRGDDVPFEFTPRSVVVRGTIPSVGMAWLILQLVRTAGIFLEESAGWTMRLFARARRPTRPRDRPCVLASTDYPRHLEPDGTNWYWSVLSDELSTEYGVDCRYLIDVNLPALRKLRWASKGMFRLLGGVLDATTAVLRKLKWASKRLSRIFDYLLEARRALRAASEVAPPLDEVREAIPVASIRLSPWRMARLCARHCRRLWQFQRLERDESYGDLWTFEGADLSRVCAPRFRRGIQQALHWEREVETRVEAIRRSGVNPLAALVHCEFYQSGMANIAACRRSNIPTVGVQHGVVYPMHLFYTLPAACVRETPTPTHFAAYGEFTKETIAGVGRYPAERVAVVGSPRLDWLVHSRPDQEVCRDRLNLPRDAFVILVATQPYDWMIQATRDLIDAVRDDPRCRVCIKFWQRDRHVAAYEALADQAGACAVEIFSDRFHDLLGACDALASSTSTTLLEATLCDKPTISLDYSNAGDPYPYVEEGVSFPARDRRELKNAIERIRDGGYRTEEWIRRRESFLRRHLGPTAEGKGAECLARFLRERVFPRNRPRDSAVPPPHVLVRPRTAAEPLTERSSIASDRENS